MDCFFVRPTNFPHSLGDSTFFDNLRQTVLVGSRSSGPKPRLDHLTVTFPGLQSHWNVNRKAKDLGDAYPHDVELMEKIGLEDCLDVGSVMLGRSLAIKQYF